MFGLIKQRRSRARVARAIDEKRQKTDHNLHIQKERRRLEKEIGQLEKRHTKATKAYKQTGNHAAGGEFRTAAFVARAAGFFGAASDLERCKEPLCFAEEQNDRTALAGAQMRQEIEKIEDRIQELKGQLERLR